MTLPVLCPRVDGKFLHVAGQRFLVRGIAYGTFAPGADGVQFPAHGRMTDDFEQMAAAGFNTVRTYTVPSPTILDAADRAGLKVIVGLPWPQHVAFLNDAALVRGIRRDSVATVRELAAHPAMLMFAVGNEIPPAVVRWHGARRVERFLRELYEELKSAASHSLFTYINFPPTEYLDLDCFDVSAFNLYLHREMDLRAYLARLQHIAGHRPLLLAEAGADSRREGLEGQAHITALHVRAALEEGACGAVAFSWTDEWWRGGRMVEDWAFGLVDADRRPKPALDAVASAFADAPFPKGQRSNWPKVSVVVCAYNAAETIDECLTSLENLTYPNFELILVNDGSTDGTEAITRRHPDVRCIDTPNGGLSVARNVGLTAAGGEIVAYTDADVRVDPDWLTYLVQPLLSDDFVGVGGPNVAPADDPWVAQCVARAPGGPTHVLLDDRTAEHIPGCNMAFWRDALLAIGGFNPVFLRAADDVDVCWRLQANGGRLGFAASALVWHRHRSTVDAFWRQQVGYGEAEAWLSIHHPDKFAGGQMLWHGRIYSPLPFVRSLRERRVNTGRWGTAAFPSVYWAGTHPVQLLPHSALWMALSSALILLGLLRLPISWLSDSWLLWSGIAGWMTTLIRCFRLAQRSDIRSLPRIGMLPAALSKVAYRVTIAWLHVVQPLARMRGRLKGMWSLPEVSVPQSVTRPPWRVALPSFHDAQASGRLLAGLANERSYWGESWINHTDVLSELAGILRASRPARVVEQDEGWHADRDLSVGIGRWAWLDARVLVEEHALGRCLLRTGVRLRLRAAGVGVIVAVAALLGLTGDIGDVRNQLALSLLPLTAAGVLLALAVWQTTRVIALFDAALTRVAATSSLVSLPVPATASSQSLVLRRLTLWRAMPVIVVLALALAGLGRLSSAYNAPGPGAPESIVVDMAIGGGVAVGLAGDVFVADARENVIRRLRPRPPAGASWRAEDIASDGDPLLGAAILFDGVADIAVAPNGDVFIADAVHNVVRRVVPSTGEAGTVVGLQGTVRTPTALALGHNGDLYVADALNHRVVVVTPATGAVRTVAADLDRPMGLALAPDGDLYIADTGSHHVQRLDLETGTLTTVATLAAPMGLAVTSVGGEVVIYVADNSDNHVHRIGADGTVTTLTSTAQLVAPTRLAHHPAGWLYVKDSSPDGVTALDLR